MAIVNKFESSEQQNNLAHLASIINLTKVDGTINAEEQAVIQRFSQKLGISEDAYKRILKNPEQYPISPNNSFEVRLELLFDLFKIIYADNRIEPKEKSLILKYAIGLDFNMVKAEEIIEKSILVFEGKLDFEQHRNLMKK